MVKLIRHALQTLVVPCAIAELWCAPDCEHAEGPEDAVSVFMGHSVRMYDLSNTVGPAACRRHCLPSFLNMSTALMIIISMALQVSCNCLSCIGSQLPSTGSDSSGITILALWASTAVQGCSTVTSQHAESGLASAVGFPNVMHSCRVGKH